MLQELLIGSLVILIIIFLILLIVYTCKKPDYGDDSLSIPKPLFDQSEHFDQVNSEQDLNDNFQLCNYNNEHIISSKNKVLIVSCYGYGNMGDNMYSEVFTKFLPDCEIVKVSDHSIFVDSNKKFSSKPPQNGYLFDFLIIGGGGLITASKLKDSHNMPFYINDAKKRNKPLFIISCGVQGPTTDFQNSFTLWKEAMNYAKLITVRSKRDKELLNTLVNPNKIHYFRDLGYIFPHIIRPYRTLSKCITLIIAGPVDDKNETIKKYVKNSKKDVVIMNMGSLKDDNNNKRMLKMNFPGVNVTKYYGSGKATEFSQSESFMANQTEMEELLRKNPELEGVNPTDLTLNKVINIIYNSEIVFTGRYHGMIFARSLGIKYDTLGMDTNKVKWEEPVINIRDTVINSYENIKLLRKAMGLPDNSDLDIMSLENSIRAL